MQKRKVRRRGKTSRRENYTEAEGKSMQKGKAQKMNHCRYYRRIACVRLLLYLLYLIIRRICAATDRLLFVLK